MLVFLTGDVNNFFFFILCFFVAQNALFLMQNYRKLCIEISIILTFRIPGATQHVNWKIFQFVGKMLIQMKVIGMVTIIFVTIKKFDFLLLLHSYK